MRYVSLGTYPIRQPVQGGQLRANAIHKVLRDCGWETRHVLVTPNRGARREMEAGDLFIEMPRRFRKQMARRKWRSDVATAEFIARSSSHRLEIARFLDDFRPDVIAVEQGWLWPALREYVETCSPEANFSIVYSSHNVEQHLLAQEAAIAGAGTDLWSARRAADIESDLAAKADLVVAVSEQDAAHFRKLNPSVVVAANGVWPRETPVGLDRWASRFAGLRTALFVGSGHPPNARGFLQMTDPDLGFLSASERIVVVGGVADQIRNDPGFLRHRGADNARIELLGMQDGANLSALIELADVVMLPIVEGGGTNIKTAEALYNRKPVVATSFALRGYEQFQHWPNVRLADRPEDFRDVLAQALRSEPETLNSADIAQLDTLLWSSTLRKLPELFAALPRRQRQPAANPGDGRGRFLHGLLQRLGLRRRS
ncbi:glycosyltransferase [Mesorhizobium sp. CA18]|uniref:glycosyltransferase n=1 Tax=unclassified Mesorhizobium TaxID=325217 RepID=UPI001CCB9A6C|nr:MULTISPECIES: glycosyltransferase [unclassified Mesorhizobium]MBZ9733010.1 glycosyltransferase [Mesorhizobium sp. CA9]MBZ9827955.1 glycosyltransferase [Mesorhizobium sp. CA18]MBZ9830660.1 glycosyltransferase [Mesorhizobium sp. CA2]MBZ9836348.1 glycosyltransferase [Mesorhizobium sp. CA3]MBZ9876352.1 glycosyltransferase [Mesorhizobium sp. Ca11]